MAIEDLIQIEVAPGLRNIWIPTARIMVLEKTDGTAVLRWVHDSRDWNRCAYCGCPLPRHNMENCRRNEQLIREHLHAREQVR